jgi:transmembrane sensor
MEKAGRIRELYVLYTEAKATEAELAEFFALADEPANEEIFRELFSGTWDELQKADPRNKQIRPFRRIPGWIRTASAAAVILMLASGTYFLLNRKSGTKPTPVAETKKPIDIAPGGNKAVLTLSNGSQIILDSVHNGLLAKQSGSSVVKTDSGQLAYQSNAGKNLVFSETSFNTLSTPRGGQYQLVLPDGTKVWLNAASSITYPTAFSGKERKVTVTGEVYMEVVHNQKMPFRVRVGDQTIEDIGTSFNINAYPDESGINTTLVQGSAKVSWNNRSELLKPGQQSRTANEVFKVVNNVDIEYVMAWRNGKMQLAHGDVKKLFREISRWYNVDVVYQGVVPEGGFSASIKRNLPLSNLLSVLNAYGVHTRVEENKIIVQ